MYYIIKNGNAFFLFVYTFFYQAWVSKLGKVLEIVL